MPEEIVRLAEDFVAATEETVHDRLTASVVPEEIDPTATAPPAPTPIPILPSALEVKKTKAAERAALKKRKAFSCIRIFGPQEGEDFDKFTGESH